MAQVNQATASPGARLIVHGIGLLLSGGIGAPILDADTIEAVDGRIAAIGRRQDIEIRPGDTVIDAKGCALCPGLIDSHVHPVAGDWTPRQNQLGWIESCLHGGVTTMTSAGEVYMPGRPKDIVGLKAFAVTAQRVDRWRMTARRLSWARKNVLF